MQIIVLNDIAAGKREPRNDRELFYRKLLDAGHKPRVQDFIVPRGLLILEWVHETPPDAGPAR